ncbi:hypothetical protein EB796_008888 [Bugula neritina]|uniref:Uncharacterized protein n=1 Tax=Bugula neritina TaxID=10212 RepID=A0A7J7K3R5_BUGNE|nr:hypothetical protein EB796_016138 [Bugula neritina]KAF6032843.1 hypothetical protein EB796_008888 [Bugula neritina]
MAPKKKKKDDPPPELGEGKHVYKNEELVKFLAELIVTNGHVKKMQPYIDLSVHKTKTLETVIADHNKFKKIPAKIFSSNALFSLNISHNMIKHLPKTIYKKPIGFLNASYNNFEALPKLPPKGELHLTYLDVSHCQIQSLPQGFNRLNCLAHLDLSFNKVTPSAT